MALDDRTLKLLELEYVDDLGNSLSDLVFRVGFLKAVYQSVGDGHGLYEFFSEKYDLMISDFGRAKEKLAIAEGRSEEHTPLFHALKNWFNQIGAAIDALSVFFEREGNPAKFRESFRPYLRYLDIIGIAGGRITCLAKIYSALVDANMLTNRYCTKLEGKADEGHNGA